MSTYQTVVRDSAGTTYLVRDAGPQLEHSFAAVPCKAGIIDGRAAHVPKTNARERLIRRVGCMLLTGEVA